MNLNIKLPKFLGNFSLHKLLYNKKIIIPFSIFISFVFWLVIMINQNPVREHTFYNVPVAIPLDSTFAKENNMEIINNLSDQPFTVTVSGPSYLVSALKVEDIVITASAVDVKEPGVYNLEVEGKHNSAKGGYTFISISPSTVSVEFDYIDTKEFTITPQLVGVGAAEGLVAEKPIVNSGESDTITISGPRTVMDTIDSVAAYAEVNKTLNETATFDAKLILYDKDEKEISSSGLTIASPTVKVTVPISKKATVSVKPVFTNMPEGLQVSSSVNHTSVTIIGPPKVISGITEISLSAIDFYSISTTSNSFDVSAVLPEGVKIIDSIDFFTVTVDTSEYSEKIFTVTNMKYSGLADSLSVKKADNIKNVKVCGPAAAIKALTANDLYAAIDLKDKSAGAHTVVVKIKSEKFADIWQVGNYSTTVTISE